MWKNKNTVAFCGAVIVSVLFVALFVYDAINCRNKNLAVYSAQTEQQASILLSDALAGESGSVKDRLIRAIENSFDTSASVYCVVGINGQVVYEKDRVTTEKMKEISWEAYMNGREDSVWIDSPARGTRRSTLPDKKVYLTSAVSAEVGEELIQLGICMRQEYLVKRGQFDLLIQHVILYTLLFSSAFIAITFFQRMNYSRLQKSMKIMDNKMIADRKQIELLETEKTRQQDADINDKNSGFLSKKTLETILGLLTPAQKAASCKIKIRMQDQSHLLEMAVLLDRMNTKGCISCLWNEDTFFMILLNGSTEDAKQFVKQLFNRYEKEFQVQAPQADVNIDGFDAV